MYYNKDGMFEKLVFVQLANTLISVSKKTTPLVDQKAFRKFG